MRHVWSEHVPHAELWAAPTMALLRSRGVGVRAAVRPDSAATAAELVARCRDAGLSIGLWPMIDDDEGRWASAWNGAGFADFTRRLLDALDAAGALPDELVMDLEPPIGRMRRRAARPAQVVAAAGGRARRARRAGHRDP